LGRIGEARIATIDSRDFAVGDMLSYMAVDEILSDRIMMKKESKDGVQTYVLGFCKKGRARSEP
jgi:hypothetical protein